MSTVVIHRFVFAALALCSTLALADPPARVGRISSVEGGVTVVGDGEANAALLNWPVTSSNHISTARGARAELRVGAAAVRLDGDSDLEVEELDDDSLRLRLHYGSASVRIRDFALLRGFELSTPQARITLSEPGWLRVDSERQPDTTVVSMLAGMGQVDAAGSTISLRSGQRLEAGSDQLRTGTAGRDDFDRWAEARDRRDDSSVTQRYLPPEVTGYEELDRNGSWQDNAEYGPLWTPRAVGADWAPYRDGRWIWMDLWGWTWIDNAAWGYAPSHYGRWVMVERRWRWAPGRVVGRPVWSPALVGWVGGGQTQLTFGGTVGRHGPVQGWFPLSPRDSYVPPYRVSPDYERRLGWHGNLRERNVSHHERREGVTALPSEQFNGRHIVPVHKGPAVIVPPTAPTPLSSAPQGPRRGNERQDWRERRAERPAGADGAPQRGPFIQPERGGSRGERPAVLHSQPERPAAAPNFQPNAQPYRQPNQQLSQQPNQQAGQQPNQQLPAPPAIDGGRSRYRLPEQHHERERPPAAAPAAVTLAPAMPVVEERGRGRDEPRPHHRPADSEAVRQPQPVERPAMPAPVMQPQAVRQPAPPQQQQQQQQPRAMPEQARPSPEAQARKEAIERRKEEARERGEKGQPAR